VGLRSKIGLPRCRPAPAPAGGAVGGTIDALYTGRGPVCGITMRRGEGTGVAGALLRSTGVDSAAIARTEIGVSAAGVPVLCSVGSSTGGSATAGACPSAVAGATAAGVFTTAIFSLPRAASSRGAGAIEGLTAAPVGGGATTTTGRAAAAVAGGLATTAPDGGFDAIAGGAGGGAMIGGAERGCGTILRGSGRGGATAGRAGTGGAATVALGAGAAGFAAGAAAGLAAGRCGCRASSSSSCFLARTAFSTSPGLEMCERSIFGTIAGAAWRVCPDAACPAGFASCAKCARTFSASSSSSELECVLPPATPSSGRRSIIARGFTSNSRARSLIRTLLICLFSVPLAAYPPSGS